MPYENVAPLVHATVRAAMVADATLTAAIRTKPTALGGGPAIYTEGEVGSGQTFPYITMGVWVAVKDNRLSPDLDGYGWNCTGQIKAISQASEAQAQDVISKVMAIFPEGTRVTVSGYGSAFAGGFDVQGALKEINAGVTTHSVPAIIRVRVYS